ncbi:hypothetical protein RESH_02345 [Rhodopirellula europaea SH398]|uniref:Uncharacterized protein n=1 Tax=Rhodopirellula europaea SH398 TaxID=1263868 RepID=M5S6F8_9BACT|nr:hypothetical protein RESH_02345 [Rhodopirellula europaea SH398]
MFLQQHACNVLLSQRKQTFGATCLYDVETCNERSFQRHKKSLKKTTR